MAEIDVALNLTKDQRLRKPRIFELFEDHKKIKVTVDTDSSLSSSSSPSLVPLISRCCYCRESSQPKQQHRQRRKQKRKYSRSWKFSSLIARYATITIVSMFLLLASAQDMNRDRERGTSDSFRINSNSHALNTSIGNNLTLNINTTNIQLETVSVTETEMAKASERESEIFSSSNKVSNRQNSSTNNGEKLSSSRGAGPGPAGVSSIHGVSVNRNNLIDGDNTLQRQLREKAKQDSLQSIKMHILMRLNLKKLPNITKPVSVPPIILENFYKKYNASLLNSMWSHDNDMSTDTPPLTDLYVSEESVTEPKAKGKSSQKKIHNQETESSTSKSSTSSDDDDNSSVENASAEMQGDDPNVFEDYQFIYNIGYNDDQQRNFADKKPSPANSNYNIKDDNGEYESILSHISSIYVFPEQPHMRHNRKSDVLRFKFDTSYSEISYVTLHLYLRGLDWIRINQPSIIGEREDDKNKDIVVAVHQALRHANSTNYTHKVKMFEFRHKIPKGLGKWVSVDLKPLFVTETKMLSSHGPNKTQEIIIKGVESWMKPLVVTTDNTSKNPLTVHIEIGSQKKHRRKRSVFLDCTESDHDMRCCRYPLKVNFTSFGWHFVVAPTTFDAYFCSGDCRVGYLEQYPHTHLAALTTSATPCCSPTKMSSLSLLYFDDLHNLVLSVIPNMSVEGCSCS